MSRSGYNDDCGDNWQFICWRGAVASAMRGKNGQAFLKEMLAALDALPDKRLISYDLENSGEVCALGAVGKARGTPMDIDPEDHEAVAARFGIPHSLACEVMFMNDEFNAWKKETPEDRFLRMRAWVAKQIKEPAPV